MVSKIWKDRKEKPMSNFFIHTEKFAGESAKNKIEKLRKKLEENRVEGIFINGMDEIAWLFNIRAKDVEFNPVGLGFAYVDTEKVILLLTKKKVIDIKDYLTKQGISVENYDNTIEFLSLLKIKK